MLQGPAARMPLLGVSNDHGGTFVYHTSMLIRGCLRELIENVEVAFILNLAYHSPLFQEIVGDLCSNRFPALVEHDFEVFSLQKRELVFCLAIIQPT